MEDPQPLPQPELPLCDSLIIWVSVVPGLLEARPPAGRAEQGTSGCHVHLLLRSLSVRDSELHLAQVARRRWQPRFPDCCPFGAHTALMVA